MKSCHFLNILKRKSRKQWRVSLPGVGRDLVNINYIMNWDGNPYRAGDGTEECAYFTKYVTMIHHSIYTITYLLHERYLIEWVTIENDLMTLPATLHEYTTKQNLQLQKQKTGEIQQRQQQQQQSQLHQYKSPPQKTLHTRMVFLPTPKTSATITATTGTTATRRPLCNSTVTYSNTSNTIITNTSITSFTKLTTAKWKKRCFVEWRHRTMTRILISNYDPARHVNTHSQQMLWQRYKHVQTTLTTNVVATI